MSDEIIKRGIAGKNLYRGLSIGVAAGLFLGHFVDANPMTEFLAALLCLALWMASEGYDRIKASDRPD